MAHDIKCVVIGVVVAFALLLDAGVATASRSIRLRGPGERGETVTYSIRKTFGPERLEASLQIICDVTFLGTIPSVIPKVVGTQFGRITGMAVDRGTSESNHCRHGEAVESLRDLVPLIERGTPGTHRELGGGVLLWDLSRATGRRWVGIYDGFQGTLPRVTGFNAHTEELEVRVDFRTIGTNIECLYSGAAYGLISFNERGVATGIQAILERTRLAKASGSFLCPRAGTFGGNYAIPEYTIELL